ncbi:hypothetical protein J6590_100515 [Homalodisca vitripennis]|nr:hypothetical protein J6590_100515 [Homalodisca vitripennis]
MPPRKKSALSRHSARAIATKRIRNNQSNDQRAKVNELNRIRTSASRMMLSQEERETSNLNDRLRMQSNRAVANRSGDARLQHDMYKQAFNYDPSADYNQHPLNVAGIHLEPSCFSHAASARNVELFPK